jgi:LysW-gamma-L-lysine carboxypeptidase
VEIDLLTSLVSEYSPTGQEEGAVAYLVKEMARLGYRSHVDEAGNAVGVIGDGPREIVLLGHIDTVPGRIEVRREDDRLYGRGSVDAKGPLACFTAAVARVGTRPGWRLVVVGAVGEEGDSRGAYALVDRHRPQMTLIGEPSGWDHITLGYKGTTWLRYSVQKDMTHTASRVESASETAVDFWNRVVAYAKSRNTGQERPFNQLTPTLRSMSSSQDGFTQSAQLHIGFRLPPEIQHDALRDDLRALAGDAALEFGDGIPAYRAEKNTPLVRAMLSGIRAAGGTPSFTLKTGTADMNIVAPVWDCPAIAYGPGDSNLDHTPGEHVLVSEYLRSIDVLAAALRELTAGG